MKTEMEAKVDAQQNQRWKEWIIQFFFYCLACFCRAYVTNFQVLSVNQTVMMEAQAEMERWTVSVSASVAGVNQAFQSFYLCILKFTFSQWDDVLRWCHTASVSQNNQLSHPQDPLINKILEKKNTLYSVIQFRQYSDAYS